MQRIKNLENKIIHVSLMAFPVIDIVTGIMSTNGMELSVGMVIKTLFLAIAFLYFVFDKKNRVGKALLIGFIIYLFLSIANSWSIVYPTAISSYIKLIFKYYFLIFCIIYFDTLKEKNETINTLKIPIKIILLTYMIAFITRTSGMSYSLGNKIGYVGWFYSANELGGLLCLLYPISIYLFFHEENSKKIEYIYPILMAFAMIMLGTKVGYLGFLLETIGYILCRIVLIKKYGYKNGLLISCLMLGSVLAMNTKMPAVENSKEKIQDIVNSSTTIIENGEEVTKVDEAALSEAIYSGRKEFLKEIKENQRKDKNTNKQEEASEESPELEKENNKKKDMIPEWILDLYLGSPYIKSNYIYLCEMDYYDMYFSFGVLGIGFFVLAIIYTLAGSIKELMKNVLNLQTLLVTMGIGITLCIAYISGHTLLSPMVSFYIAACIGLLPSTCEKKGSEKKNILIGSVHLDVGGIEKTLINLLNEINYEEFNVDLLVLLNKGQYADLINPNAKIITPYGFLTSPIINGKNIVCKVVKHTLYNKCTAWLWVRNKKYDTAVDYAGYYNFITSYIVRTNAKKNRIWLHTKITNAYNRVPRKYKKFDKIIAVSEDAKNDFISLNREYENKIEVLWNIIEQPKGNKEKVKWPKNSLRILTIGRLNKQKRYDRLVEVAKVLNKKNMNYHIIALGEGEEKSLIEKLIKDYAVEKQVELLGNKKNVRNYMETADLFLLTSDYEGLPTVLVEALSCKLPIIATDVCGTHEVARKIAPKGSIKLTNLEPSSIASEIIKFKKKEFEFNLEDFNQKNIKKIESVLR